MNEAYMPENRVHAAWQNAIGEMERTPLLEAIEGILKDPDLSYSVDSLSYRIASPDEHLGPDGALGGRRTWSGDWYVSNRDLLAFSRFRMWLHRLYGPHADQPLIRFGPIATALHYKRMSQAWERYANTGLTPTHCRLLAELQWDLNTSRDDSVSLFVQGKRPFGNSSIVADIYEHAGWDMDWPEDDGPDEAQQEGAWKLFDELVFAAPDAVKLAADAHGKEPSK